MTKKLGKSVRTTLRIGALMLEVDEVYVRHACSEIPRLIRESAVTGQVFLVRNAKNPSPASVLLVSPEILLLRSARRRKLCEVLDLLPFNTKEIPRLHAGLPNNSKKVLRVPDCSKSR